MKKKEEFNQAEYIAQYNKDNYIQLKVRLKPEEKRELDEAIKKMKLTSNTEFVRWAIKEAKKKYE